MKTRDEILKAQQDTQNNIAKSIDVAEPEFEKGRAAQMGEVREHGGKKMKKTPKGWVPVERSKDASSTPSAGAVDRLTALHEANAAKKQTHTSAKKKNPYLGRGKKGMQLVDKKVKELKAGILAQKQNLKSAMDNDKKKWLRNRISDLKKELKTTEKWQDQTRGRGLAKGFDGGSELMKGRKAQIGEVRKHGGVDFKKIAEGKWVPVADLKGKPAVSSKEYGAKRAQMKSGKPDSKKDKSKKPSPQAKPSSSTIPKGDEVASKRGETKTDAKKEGGEWKVSRGSGRGQSWSNHDKGNERIQVTKINDKYTVHHYLLGGGNDFLEKEGLSKKDADALVAKIKEGPQKESTESSSHTISFDWKDIEGGVDQLRDWVDNVARGYVENGALGETLFSSKPIDKHAAEDLESEDESKQEAAMRKLYSDPNIIAINTEGDDDDQTMHLIERTIRSLGYEVEDHPDYEGTDSYGISIKKPTQ